MYWTDPHRAVACTALVLRRAVKSRIGCKAFNLLRWYFGLFW